MEWEGGRNTAKHLRHITTKMQAYNSYEIYRGFTKRSDVALLSRLRTGRCSLHQYLHRFRLEESPRCLCSSGANETVEHYLIHRSRYNRERATLIQNVGAEGMWIEKLLGNTKLIKHMLDFVKETQ